MLHRNKSQKLLIDQLYKNIGWG